MSTSTIQFTVLTHIEDNKFLLVNIFQNIIYTQIYIYIYIYLYSVPSVESFIHVYMRRKVKSFEIIYILFLLLWFTGRAHAVWQRHGGWRRHFSTHSYCSETVGQRRRCSLKKTWKYTSITKSFSCSLFNTLSVPGWNKKMWDRNRP